MGATMAKGLTDRRPLTLEVGFEPGRAGGVRFRGEIASRPDAGA